MYLNRTKTFFGWGLEIGNISSNWVDPLILIILYKTAFLHLQENCIRVIEPRPSQVVNAGLCLNLFTFFSLSKNYFVWLILYHPSPYVPAQFNFIPLSLEKSLFLVVNLHLHFRVRCHG